MIVDEHQRAVTKAQEAFERSRDIADGFRCLATMQAVYSSDLADLARIMKLIEARLASVEAYLAGASTAKPDQTN